RPAGGEHRPPGRNPHYLRAGRASGERRGICRARATHRGAPRRKCALLRLVPALGSTDRAEGVHRSPAPAAATRAPVVPGRIVVRCAPPPAGRAQARGWAWVNAARRRSPLTWVYRWVVEREECPSTSCTARRSAPPSNRWVAAEWRSACGETSGTPE